MGALMTDEADARREIAKLDYAAQSAEAAERVKHQVMLVDRGLQGLLFINGGALVALFSLIGSSAHLQLKLDFVWAAFAMFAAGLVFSLVSNFAAFLSQGFFHAASQYTAWEAQRFIFGLDAAYADNVARSYQRGRIAELSGVVAALAALIAFIVGCGLALAGVLPRT